jgi:uncharacterized protein (TIGR03643 family)
MLRVITMNRKLPELPPALQEELIKLAWADDVPFETIFLEFGLTENQVRACMRAWQTPKTYTRWRIRVEGRAARKHQKRRTVDITGPAR